MATSSDPLKPEDFLRFVETDDFVAQWESLGLDNDTDLWDLQISIMRNPEIGKGDCRHRWTEKNAIRSTERSNW